MREITNAKGLIAFSREEYDREIKAAYDKGYADGKSSVSSAAKKPTKSKSTLKTDSGKTVDFRAAVVEK